MWTFLRSLFNKTLALFLEFFKEVFPPAKAIVIGQLSRFAVLIIDELSVEDITNDQKRADAFKKIKAYAKANAIEAKDSLINLVIEMAVQKIKG